MPAMKVDFEKLRLILLPHVLRRCALLDAMMHSMFVPLKDVYRAFVRYVADEERERMYGPTVAQLRAVLAYHLGIDASLVLLGDVANRDVIDLRRQSDGPAARVPVGTAALALWSDDMVWWSRDFTVQLPKACRASDAEVKALLERWKMASSRFTIKYE